MKIEQITSEEEATSILSLDDPRLEKQVLSRVQCSKAEWVQWIVDNLNKANRNLMRLWAVKEDRKIKAYLVAINAVHPPLSRSCLVLYQCFYGMTDNEGFPYHKELLEKVKGWARICGARGIVIQTDYPLVNSRLGFEEEGHSMVIKL